ncbi:MAG: endonuclease, partial [Xanthomonadales bacterium]|nr:endonuclease [Xanthomonadales bacterium]
KYIITTLALLPMLSTADVSDLLITEIAVTPTAGEFIEIHNSGVTDVDLTDVYLTDATFANGGVYYYQIVTGNGGGGGFADFHSRFPNGAMILAGQYQTIALNGSDDFNAVYGQDPTYELYEDGGVPDAIADMLEATPDSINGQGGLSGGEVAVLYSWDGLTDLVEDIDYVLWGDKTEAIDKTGIAMDGPDVGIATSPYLNDTVISNQAVVMANQHPGGESWQRNVPLDEGIEIQSGGNGINGSDETSEDFNNTFYVANPTPNSAGTPPPPPVPSIIINEVDAIGTSEFIEIYSGFSNTSLNDVTLVFYQGSDDTIYNILDLSGNNTNFSGYFLIGDTSLTPDMVLPANSLDDDASAVAIYFSNATNFSIGDPVTATDLIDALVYDSNDADDLGLLAVLNVSGGQVDEDGNLNANAESNSRCPNGSGGALNTSSYKPAPPTAGSINNQCPIPTIGEYYAGVDTTNAMTLRTTLHDIIRVALSFDYSAAGNINDTWNILSEADADPLATGFMIMVYKNESLQYFGGGIQAYNREHTWPQSRGFHQNSLGPNNAARTDAHHLMISNVGYNSDRGNNYFDNCNAACNERVTDNYNGIGGGSGVYPGNSNWFNGSVFEVWEQRKGDIARAMMYMDVRYEASQSDPNSSPVQLEPDLQLVENPAELGSGIPKMARLSTLLQWHIDDPVDQTEIDRNNVVFSFQENRNPFVDHPEWAECIFQDICPQATDSIFQDSFE